ncbi:MAG TPA: hypothetical protein VGX96_16760 [Candidatus Elarobacter sp.]|jgi:hypothetical protein|nr:hypothetical protein [Candidatus Elarobacter sp.]
MQRFLKSIAAGFACAAILTACGRSGGSAPVPRDAVQTSHQRVVHGGGGGSCTQDSYGYCVGSVQQSGVYRTCDDGENLITYWYGQSIYNIYYHGSFYGTFTYSNIGASGCPPPATWSPAEPSAATGDPNLP